MKVDTSKFPLYPKNPAPWGRDLSFEILLDRITQPQWQEW